MQKKLLMLLVLAVMLVILSSCGEQNGQQAYSGSETATPVPTPIITTIPPEETTPPPQEKPPEMIDDGFILPDSDVRPIAVMIDNQGDDVLPQGGIAQAQIVYEILTEYNITRYLAFFWGTMPDMIGPVRSSRHYFLDYSMEYDAIYTHFGWSEFAQRDIKKLKINNINGLVNGNAFWDLTKDKKNWQDSYTSKTRIENEIAKLKYSQTPKKPFPFTYHNSFVEPANGEKASDIFIKFSNSGSSTCGYLYDVEKGLYKRMRMGKPHIERNTNAQVMVRNIIVMEIASPKIANDRYGRINLSNIGTGDGLFITGGKAVKIKWKKDSRDAQTTYEDESGNPIILNRGQTWVEIVPTMKLIKVE